MARRTTKKKDLTPEEKLAQALVPVEEQPYEVPGNWCWVRLHHLLEPSKRKTEDFSDLSIKYVGLEHMEKDCGIVSFGFTNELKSTKNIFTTGQLLYGKLRPYLNKHGIAQFDGVCSTDILVFSARKSTTAPFVNYFFDQQFFLDYVISNSKGINLPRVSETVVLEAICPLPPLPEQLRIVARIESLFAKLDEAKEKAQAVVDGFEERKAAILHKAFTGELTRKWREERGIGKESWTTDSLGRFGTLERGRSKHRPRNDPSLFNGPYPFIQTGDVASSGRYVTSHKQTLSEKGVLQSRMFPKGTLCITIAANIGNTSILSYDCCFPDSVVGFTPNEGVLSEYIYYLFNTIQQELEANAPATAQKNINLKVLNGTVVTVPKTEEQQEIVHILDSILDKQEQAKSASEQVLDQIDTMKKAILARAFRGELGTNDPQEESAVELVRRALDE